MESMCNCLDSLNDDPETDRRSVQNIANTAILTSPTLKAMLTSEIPNQGQTTNLGWKQYGQQSSKVTTFKILTTITEGGGVDSGTQIITESARGTLMIPRTVR